MRSGRYTEKSETLGTKIARHLSSCRKMQSERRLLEDFVVRNVFLKATAQMQERRYESQDVHRMLSLDSMLRDKRHCQLGFIAL